MNWSWWEATLWGHIIHHSLITTMQFHTVANFMILQPWDLHSVGKKRKRTKCILFFLPWGHHFKMSWCGCEFLSAFPPPALSGGKSTDFLCLNGLAKDNFYMRKREKKIHFLFFFFCAWFVQPLQNGSSVIVLCSWELIWILCRPEWEKTIFGLSVFGQKPETLKLV